MSEHDDQMKNNPKSPSDLFNRPANEYEYASPSSPMIDFEFFPIRRGTWKPDNTANGVDPTDPQKLAEATKKVFGWLSEHPELFSKHSPNTKNAPLAKPEEPPLTPEQVIEDDQEKARKGSVDPREDMAWAARFHPQMLGIIKEEHGKPAPRTPPGGISQSFDEEDSDRIMAAVHLVCGR